MASSGNTLITRIQKALSNDDTLAREIIKELSDKDDLLERIEDAVAEKMSFSQRLEVAEEQLQALVDQTTKMQQLEKDYRAAVEAKNKFAEELQQAKMTSGAGLPAAATATGSDEIMRELEELRRTRQELEQELTMRDEVLASLRADLQGGGGATGDGAYDALLAEKNNLAEQLTLALSQLEEVTDREGLVAKLDQKTRQVLDMEDQYQGLLAENNSLRARVDESEDKVKRLEQHNRGQESEGGHNPATIWIVGILLFVAIYGSMNWRRQPAVTPRPTRTTKMVPVVKKAIEIETFEEIARRRLEKQKGSITTIITDLATEKDVDEERLREALNEASESDKPFLEALSLIASGDFDEALVPLQREDERRKASLGSLFYFRGRTAFFAGRIEDARRFLKIAVERDYTSTDAWRALGDLYVFEDKTSDALRCYKEAIKINEKDALAHIAVGGIHSLEDNLDEALKSYEKAVKADSGLVDAHFALGMLYQRKEDWGKAAQYFEETILLEAGNARAHWSLAKCYEIQGKVDKARQHKERAKALGYQDLGPPGPTPDTTTAGGS